MLTPHILSESRAFDYFSEEFRRQVVPEIEKLSLKEVKKKNETD